MVQNNNIELYNVNHKVSQLSISSNSSGPPYSELDKPDDALPTMQINRFAYDIPHFNESFEPISVHKTLAERLKMLRPDMSKKAWIPRLKIFFPILVWLPKYDIRNNLIADIMVGITIAVFQIPQSIGYSLLAHLPPVIGIYSSFYPNLAYILLGTSSHSVVGTFSIVSGLMTGDLVLKVMSELGRDGLNPNSNSTHVLVGYEDVTNLDIVIMTAVVCGLYMTAFGILQLGFLTDYLPNELIGGYLTSCSIYVFTSQIRYLLGVNYTYYSGILALIDTYIEIFSRLKEVNLITLLISGVCLIVLLIFKEVIDVQLQKRLGIKLPLPIDLCLVIAGTLTSNYMNLSDMYHIKIVGSIPNGFVGPVAPKFKLFPYVWARCIPIAIVAFVITFSAGKTMSVKYGYTVDPNQEMIALGVTNIWGGIFHCLPTSSSLSRAALMDTAGGKTFVVHIVNAICVAIVIAFLGSLLSSLPNCVIGAVIAIALTSLISKVRQLKQFWDISKLDASIWIITFIAVIVLNVDVGFYVGLGCSIVLLIYKSQRPKTYLLASIEGTEIYVPIKKFNRAKEVRGVKIYQFCGALNYANINYFTSELQAKSGFDVNKLISKKKKVEKTDRTCCLRFSSSQKALPLPNLSIISTEKIPTHIIIDCSMLSYIDTAGANAVKKLVNKYKQIEVTILLTGCAAHVEDLLNKIEFFNGIPSKQVFKSIHDAITYIKSDINEDLVYERRNIKGYVSIYPKPVELVKTVT